MFQKTNAKIIFYDDNGKKFMFIDFNYKVRRRNSYKLHYYKLF